MVNPKFKDHLYLEGAYDGLLRYGKFLASTKDHYPKRTREKPQLVTEGLLDDAWMADWADSKLSQRKPNLSALEGSHSFECFNFEPTPA